jgi:hypothetical protein
MRRKRRRRGLRLRVLVAAAVLAVSASMTSAYTSTATGARGGQGAGSVSGYAVSAVHFELGAGAAVSGVGFRLAPLGARSVHVQLAAGGPWFACSVAAGHAACPLPAGTSAAGADRLSVVASS